MSKWSIKFGISEELHAKLVANGGTRAFAVQRQHAKRRGIQWKLTIGEWWQVWDQSGRWAERGRGRDDFCMGRSGSVGAFAVGNVYICAVWQNLVGAPVCNERPDHVRGVHQHGRKWRARFRCKNLGSFTTKTEAIAARKSAEKNDLRFRH